MTNLPQIYNSSLTLCVYGHYSIWTICTTLVSEQRGKALTGHHSHVEVLSDLVLEFTVN